MQQQGLTKEKAAARISLFDINGLIEPSRKNLSSSQQVYAHQYAPSKDLLATIESLKPNILIGVSTTGGAFNQRVVETMSKLNERPIIFALSNPTEKAECSAEQAYSWSKGAALCVMSALPLIISISACGYGSSDWHRYRGNDAFGSA